ncbi:MAG: hypothetical protein ACI8YQ_005031 [Polaribacter sp.]|jgi:hypothetical protein
MGTSQLVSVPYALFTEKAQSAVTAESATNDMDTDPNNEIQELVLNGYIISLTDGNSVDIEALIPLGGTDNQELTLNGTILTIESGNNIDLASLSVPGPQGLQGDAGPAGATGDQGPQGILVLKVHKEIPVLKAYKGKLGQRARIHKGAG